MAENALACDVCGENDFELKEGFYYCNECGTQNQQVYHVEIETGFEDVKYVKSSKIKTVIEKPELTSWECFNYLLRGLVEELIELGAKEELKITALQLWTAYLRKTEVAFFSKNKPKLPKLGPRFSSRDAKILYNYQNRSKKKKKNYKYFYLNLRSRALGPNKTNYKSSPASVSEKRKWKKKKRSLMESEYVRNTSASQRTSSAATTSRGIRLEFTKIARKYLKRVSSKSRLAKHEVDDKSDMECHLTLPPRTLPEKYLVEQLGRKTIYTILFLALNLIEDDIQLCDVLRFMREGHLSSRNISHLFPENVAESCEKLIHSNSFSSRRYIFLDSIIRAHAVSLCKLIDIPELRTPNICKLAIRFMNDLCLPKGFAVFLERLINFCPPEMKFRVQSEYTPCYEGRAMAYIIFVLKLLFGLDDIKEKAISQSARNINKQLDTLKCLKRNKLFVWDEWQNYIEMRKIVISQCHLPTSLALKQSVNISNYVDLLKFEQGVTEEDVIKHKKEHLLKMERIFDNFQMNYEEKNFKFSSTKALTFPPSLTPYSFYLKNILENPPDDIYIPDNMRKDHSELDIASFLKPTNLKELFKEHLIQLDITRIECNPKRKFIGIFKDLSDLERRRMFGNVRARIPTFDIEEADWLDDITAKEKIYKSTKNWTTETVKQQPFSLKNVLLQIIAKPNEGKMVNKVDKVYDNTELRSAKSFNIFSESNMCPMNDNMLKQPRANLENDDLFEDVSDDDINETSDEEQVYNEKLKLLISDLDYWMLLGDMINFPSKNFVEVKDHFPCNFLWLLETCSQHIGINTEHLYQEVLTIENYFINVLEPVQNTKNILRFREEGDNTQRIKSYKLLW